MKKFKFTLAILLIFAAFAVGGYLCFIGWFPCGVVAWLFLTLVANKLIRSI